MRKYTKIDLLRFRTFANDNPDGLKPEELMGVYNAKYPEKIKGVKRHGMQQIKCIKDCILGKDNFCFKRGEIYDCNEYYIQLEVFNKEKTKSISFSMPFENPLVLNNFKYILNMKFLKSFE